MSSWVLGLCRGGLTLACLLFALPSSAQPSASPSTASLVTSDDYAAVIKEAVAEFEDDHFAEARALFARAHELSPSARTWRGLGISAFALRAYEDAVSSLENALASDARPLTGELRSETETLLQRAYGFVGRYVLGLHPTSAQLWVDDVETVLRSGDRLLLSIGRHRLEARAPAYVSDLRAVDVTGGENTGLSFTLAPAAEPEPVVATPSEAARTAVSMEGPLPISERAPGAPLYKNPWLRAGVGAAVVVIVVATSVAATRDRSEVGDVSRTGFTPKDGVIYAP